MKKRIGVVIVCLSLNIIFANALKTEKWKREDLSPSKEYSYNVHETNDFFDIEILKNDKVVFEDKQRYRVYDRFYIAWDKTKDTLWVYSSDIGTYYYYLQDDIWIRGAWSDGKKTNSDIPIDLKNAIPRLKNY